MNVHKVKCVSNVHKVVSLNHFWSLELHSSGQPTWLHGTKDPSLVTCLTLSTRNVGLRNPLWGALIKPMSLWKKWVLWNVVSKPDPTKYGARLKSWSSHAQTVQTLTQDQWFFMKKWHARSKCVALYSWWPAITATSVFGIYTNLAPLIWVTLWLL